MSTPPTRATPSASEPLLRLAGPEDLADAARVTVAAYVGTYLAAEDAYVAHLSDTAGRASAAELWVALVEGRLAGTVTFCPPGSSLREIAREGEGEFRMLAVEPRARGHGVGEALVRRCLDRARDLGLVAVRMSTMREMTPAHRLYTRLGFTRAPQDDWSPVPGVDLLAFHRELT